MPPPLEKDMLFMGGRCLECNVRSMAFKPRANGPKRYGCVSQDLCKKSHLIFSRFREGKAKGNDLSDVGYRKTDLQIRGGELKRLEESGDAKGVNAAVLLSQRYGI